MLTLLEQFIKNTISEANENIDEVNLSFISMRDKFGLDYFTYIDEHYNKNHSIIEYVIFAKVCKLLSQEFNDIRQYFELENELIEENNENTVFAQKLRRSVLLTHRRDEELDFLNVKALGKYTPSILEKYEIVIYHDEHHDLQYISKDKLQRVLRIAKNIDEFIILVERTMRDVA